jgi:predicted MPP superfamily phosphohydrolase
VAGVRHGRAAAALSAAAALTLFYMVFESQWLRRVDVDIDVVDLPDALEGFTIVQLSDLHLGSPSLNERVFAEALELTERIAPHLIAITGDLVTSGRRLAVLEDGLRRLSPPYGMFAVLGNHDHGAAKVVRAPAVDLSGLAECGVTLLDNACVTVPVGDGASLQICGIDDWAHHFGDLKPVLAALDRQPTVVRLLLSHYAEAVLATAAGDFALTLSGDTHGGQICLPWPGGRVMLSEPRARFREGLYEVDGRRVYVTRGIGTSFLPLRFMCRPEIVVLRLVRAA